MRILLPLLFALGLHAQDAASVARTVHDEMVNEAALAQALQSSDALVRATAARVAMVRGVTALVPSLRTLLEKESNAEAARELVRAVVILGSAEDVAFAASHLSRFPASIDAAFGDALRRTSHAPYSGKLRAEPRPVLSLSKRRGLPPEDTKGASTLLREPLFTLPLAIPRGLGPEILRATRCRHGWIGVADVTRDAAGRVTAIDTKNVRAERGCIEALRTMARLSLAEPGEPASTQLLVMRVAGTRPCFDEAAVTNRVPAMNAKDVKPPRVLDRVEPHYPDSVRRSSIAGNFTVVAEATITSEGCVRDLRLVQQTVYPELNVALLEALSKWTFAPGTLDGVPVDVLFNLTTNFRH
ncbi:MAG TPA: TonB family protein [Thermoanaerobaculia bacterium]|nr:TonB family protein [Thermoanaerobaculia bacterium]